MNNLIHIQHSFRTSSRAELVQKLRELVIDIQESNASCLSQREIAFILGVSESTWKRARGGGGVRHKVDIYYLLKFISHFSHKGKRNVILLTPSLTVPDFIYKALAESMSQNH